MSIKGKSNKITCLKCSDKYIDCRGYVFCTLETSPIHSFGYLGRKEEGYKKTPKWCPKNKKG